MTNYSFYPPPKDKRNGREREREREKPDVQLQTSSRGPRSKLIALGGTR